MIKKFISGLPIRIKILGGTALALIMMGIFIFIYFPNKSAEQINSAMQNRYHSMAEMISLGVGVGMESGNFDIILEALKWAKKDSSVIYIEVLDEKQVEYASYNPGNIKIDVSFLLLNNDVTTFNNKQVHIAKIPVFYQNKNFGEVFLVTSLDPINKLIRKNTNVILTISFTIFLIAFVFSFWFSKTITKQLVNLHQAINQISVGNYDINFKVSSNDEIGILARSFIDMAKKIKLFISEEAMRVSEERYSEMVETSHDIIWTLNAHGEFTYINKRLEEITGHKASDWLGKEFITFIHPGDEQQYPSAFNKPLMGNYKSHEVQINSTSGEAIVLAVSSSAQIGNNEIIGLVCFGRDITKQKEAEKQLRENLEFNKSLLATIPSAMDVVDEDGNILFLNSQMEQIIGPDKLNRKCWNIYRDDKTKGESCPLSKTFSIGVTESVQCDGILGGRSFEIFQTAMIFNGNNAYMEVFYDITERKSAELELKSALIKAQESDRLKSAFLANMSHEIRTPLNSIVGFSELLADPDFEAEQKTEFINLIISNGNNLLTIISDIMDISKMEAGEIKIRKNQIDIQKFVLSIKDQFSIQVSEKKLEFKLNCPENMENTVIINDAERLGQIFNNLINNAIKFTSDGSIEIGYQVRDKMVEFLVKDTGIGIPAEYHEAIFERFRQVEAENSRKYGGNGLGLAICKNLVGLMGGKIWLESEDGKGSIFYFTLPYQTEPIEKKDIN